MYEPEAESDEDNEVYFLKPVNEYNIVEKIKEANKQLFGELIPTTTTAAAATTITTTALASMSKIETEPLLSNGHGSESIKITNNNNNTNGESITTTTTSITRKVTFALNLENYEPIPNKEEESVEGEESNDDDDDGDGETRNNNNHKVINKKKFQCAVIKEETESEIMAARSAGPLKNNSYNKKEKENAPLNEQNAEEATTANETVEQIDEESENNNNTTENIEQPADMDEQSVEEICEEIVLIDIEQDVKDRATKSSTLVRRNTIMKQATFDFDEQDNKSMTNLLTDSDGEDEYRPLIQDNEDSEHGDAATLHNQLDDDLDELINYVDTDEEDTANADVDADADVDDDDDDDDLSLIVASYLPHDFDYAQRERNAQAPSSSNSSNAGNTKKRSYFSKRFTFRRKVPPNNAIGSSASNSCRSGHRAGRSPCKTVAGEYDIKDLKLNYKTCCEYRYAVLDKLPKYTGYMSEYGLSQEQLEARQQKLKIKKRSTLEQTLRTKEQELRKMQDNERAFTKWLKNKMRFPINKTRNMFDVKSNKQRGGQ